MPSSKVMEEVSAYLRKLPEFGIHPEKVVLFGSQARGDTHEWSDVDLIVVAPEFDGEYTLREAEALWRATADFDSSIEPIACGVHEWETDDGRPILEAARLEGIVIEASEGNS